MKRLLVTVAGAVALVVTGCASTASAEAPTASTSLLRISEPHHPAIVTPVTSARHAETES